MKMGSFKMEVAIYRDAKNFLSMGTLTDDPVVIVCDSAAKAGVMIKILSDRTMRGQIWGAFSPVAISSENFHKDDTYPPLDSSKVEISLGNLLVCAEEGHRHGYRHAAGFSKRSLRYTAVALGILRPTALVTPKLFLTPDFKKESGLVAQMSPYGPPVRQLRPLFRGTKK
jgi:hypothetical protein